MAGGRGTTNDTIFGKEEAGEVRSCAFRIKQTLWSTHIIGWGEGANYSESYSVRWLSDKGRHHFKLAWLHLAKRNEAEADPGGFHLGLHEMHYLPKQCGRPPTFMGWYINNRHWVLEKNGEKVKIDGREVTGVGSTADITLEFVGSDPNEEVCRIIEKSAVVPPPKGGVRDGGEADNLPSA
jgi:hypothetical protein